MKKSLTTLVIFLGLILNIHSVNAMTFSEGYQQTSSKPMLLSVYATWSNGYQAIEQNFQSLQKNYGDKMNFVLMDIANPETKEFNDKFHIYPKLPYVLMFRDGGRVTRYVQKDCAINQSCLADKVRSFIP